MRETSRESDRERRERRKREKEKSNSKLAAIEGAIQISREKAPEISETQKANAVKQRIEAFEARKNSVSRLVSLQFSSW